MTMMHALLVAAGFVALSCIYSVAEQFWDIINIKNAVNVRTLCVLVHTHRVL